MILPIFLRPEARGRSGRLARIAPQRQKLTVSLIAALLML